MFCHSCGKRLEEDMSFCPYCGEKARKVGEVLDASASETQIGAISQHLEISETPQGQEQSAQELSAEGEVKGQEEKKKKPIGLIVGAVFAILFVFAFIGILGSSVAEDASSSTPAISEEEYKASCEKISYSDLARNPDTYKGKKVVFTGKVIQVLESGSNGGYRVNVTRGSYGIWTDTIWMTTKIDTNNRILEDDVITIYGESTGIYTYETVMGNELSIPSVKGVYVYLNE